MAVRKVRADHDGAGKTAYQNARKKIIAAQNICGICGQPVNKKLKGSPPRVRGKVAVAYPVC